MASKRISEEELEQIKKGGECPVCGDSSKFIIERMGNIPVQCTACGSYVSISGFVGPLYYAMTYSREFVKTKEEALEYLAADNKNVLSYGHYGLFITKRYIEENLQIVHDGALPKINEVAFVKPYVLYKAKHITEEKHLDCDGSSYCTCPYCGYEDADSWELGNDVDEATCCRCGRRFKLNIELSRTYSTERIPGEEDKNPE
jgi:transcription elongation factor Elf1